MCAAITRCGLLTLVVDLPIAVDVSFTDHPVDLGVRQLLAYKYIPIY